MINWIKDLFRGNLLGGKRSSKWSTVRKAFLLKNPTCSVCGCKSKLLKPNQVHHILPFYLSPVDELNFQNLLTLCPRDHFLYGHYLSWRSYGKNVKIESNQMLERIKNRP